MSNPHALHQSPQIREGYENEALQIFTDLAAEQSDELGLLEYQLFAGMAQLHEPCSPATIQYLIGKSQEEFTEFSEATKSTDREHELEEFGDFTWAVNAIVANLTPFGRESDIRPQLASYVRDALQVNGINKVSNWTFEDGMSLPTIKGISGADLSRYKPIFYGPLRQAPYPTLDGKTVNDSTADELLEIAETSLHEAHQLLADLIKDGEEALPPNVHAYNSVGFSLANSWILTAALLQKRHGVEAIQNSMFGNIQKLTGRIATGVILKTDR